MMDKDPIPLLADRSYNRHLGLIQRGTRREKRNLVALPIVLRDIVIGNENSGRRTSGIGVRMEVGVVNPLSTTVGGEEWGIGAQRRCNNLNIFESGVSFGHRPDIPHEIHRAFRKSFT